MIDGLETEQPELFHRTHYAPYRSLCENQACMSQKLRQKALRGYSPSLRQRHAECLKHILEKSVQWPRADRCAARYNDERGRRFDTESHLANTTLRCTDRILEAKKTAPQQQNSHNPLENGGNTMKFDAAGELVLKRDSPCSH